jgi:alkaline phosphatase D
MMSLTQLDRALRSESGLSRRIFLAYCSALAATPLLARVAEAQVTPRAPSFSADPFTLGVASGDPDQQSVVLWTRLAPAPLQPDGGLPPQPIPVTWELADDDAMTRIVRTGTTAAAPHLAHSVHVEVDNLQPDRWYFYRFRCGDAVTPIARTRTLPLPSSSPAALHFAVASCQNYEMGHYTAYQHMAADDLDLVFHLGDYIYERAGRDGLLRKHAGGMLMTLSDYRIRHAQYRSDKLLQSAHARCPWFVTWDDHEASNNYADEIDGQGDLTPAQFLLRRAAAYQAYYEMMPLRAASLPKGPDMQLYRAATFGNLAQFNILDTRQYRTDQPNNDKRSPLNSAALDPANTIMGDTQKQWLKNSLSSSSARWNVLAQQVMVGMLARPSLTTPEDAATPDSDDHTFSMDSWSGYAHERIELVRFLADRKISNPVVLTGDVHAHYLNELRIDDRQHDTPVVATEFVGTSISSGGDGNDRPNNLNWLMSANPGLKFHNRQRGYLRCTVTPDRWQTDFMVTDRVTTPDSPIQTRAAFVVEAGDPTAKPA